ncbi:Hemolysin, plasmid [Pelagimonas phthalicica]|uniref:Hemolysin, plasmid n=1 Tax=Pelagimonas phthalicica TaxID=1037362 RepID=A0A238JIC5_9RHOB|nr:Hint domain-containing protein [Pelagimonas phthalicica]TDS89966.1 hemolysin type calcium-binding protein [Pelagimonas phthalicica]SMX30133.1 Hemolysin, plasmid [Pelagimonas phthalicica]
MATYTVTTSNWNSPAFWSGVSEGADGHELDFSGLGSDYTVEHDVFSGQITISDGTTTFVIGDFTAGASDAYLGGTTLLTYFDTVSGSEGDDTLVSSTGSDTLEGGGGSDTFVVGNGNETIIGGETGSDMDIVDISGADDALTVTFTGDEAGTYSDADGDSGAFSEVEGFFLSTGDDSVDASAATTDGVFAVGRDGDDTLSGGGGDDTFVGGEGADVLTGNDGADSLSGGLNGDTISGGDGADSVDGGSGSDLIDLGAGDDEAAGGSGRDTISGGEGNDTIYGDDADIGTDAGTLGSFDFSAISSSGDVGTGVIGQYAIYDNIGTTSDGTVVQARITILDADDPNIQVDFGTNSVYINENGEALAGTGVTLGFEFFDQATGEPIQISGGFTFHDVDTTSESVTALSADVESLTLSAAPVTNLTPADSGEQLSASSDGTSSGNADENHWAQFAYTGQHSLVFEVTSRGAGTNYAFSTDGFSSPGTTIYATPEDQNDSIDGGLGDDLIYGMTGDDTLNGDEGQDTLNGGVGNDLIDGGADQDVITFEDGFGNDTVAGGEAVTTGSDFDRLDLSGVTGNGVSVTFTGDEAGNVTSGSDSITLTEIEAVTLTDQDDSFTGGSGNEVVDAGAGQDTLIGGAGDDSLSGGDDEDFFQLGDGFGADTITGGEGGSDNDTIDFSGLTTDATVDLSGVESGSITSGADSATFSEIEVVGLGGGRDTVVLADGSGSDTVSAFDMTDSGDGSTNDQLDVSGLTSDGGTTPVTTDDVVVSDDGSGNAVLTFPGGEAITLVGVAPADVNDAAELQSIGIPAPSPIADFIVEGTGAGETIDVGYLGDPEGDVIDGDDHSDGSDADLVYGYGGDDSISSGADADTVYGGAGNDTLDGGAGADALYGGTGDDSIQIGGGDTAAGFDGDDLFTADSTLLDGTSASVTGGENAETGGDTLSVGDYTGSVTVDLSPTDPEAGTMQLGTTTINFSEIEHVETGDADDSVTGGDGNDSVSTGAGADTVDGGAGDDVFDIGAGDGEADVIRMGDGDGNDTIIGFEAPTDNGDGTYSPQDLLDLSGMTDASGNPISTEDIDVTDTNGDGTGDAVLNFPDGTSLTLSGVPMSDVEDKTQLFAMGVTLSPGDFIVEGTTGADLIDETYSGDPEGDFIENNDHSDGSNADSVLAGDGDDTILSGVDNDTIDAGEGHDSVDAGTGDDSVHGGAGGDTLLGGEGHDSVRGGDGDDSLVGGDGSDSLYGEVGSDTVLGGAGDDTLEGNEGADTLIGGTGNDWMRGSYDNDALWGGEGDDFLWGGFGDDTFHIENNFGNDTVDAEGVAETVGDTLDLSAVTDALRVDLTQANAEAGTVTDGTSTLTFDEIENIILGSGTDTLVLADLGGSDTVGGFESPTDNGDGSFTGNDLLDVTGLTNDDGDPVTTDDVTVTDDGSGNAVLTFPGMVVLTLEGVSPSEVLTPAQLNAIGVPLGSVSNDYIVSGTGAGEVIDTAYTGDPHGDMIDNLDHSDSSNDDSVEAGDGDDTIIAGAGDDTVHGQGGDDVFVSGSGLDNDSLIGGETGETDGDTVDLTAISDDLTVTFSGDEVGTVTDGTDTLSFEEIETLALGAGNDSVTGSAGDESIAGNGGADTIDGGAGDDTIALGASDGVNDELIFEDGDGNDVIEEFEAPTDNGDGTFTGNDQLDVTGLTDAGGDPVTTDDVTVTDSNGDGTGDAILTFPNGESLTLVGVPVSEVSSPEQLEAIGIPAAAPVSDYVVSGTGAGEVIDTAYTGDPQGDMIDNADHSDGSDDDSVEAGEGDDTIYAGEGDDTVHGEGGDDRFTIDAGLDNDSLIGGETGETLGDEVNLTALSDDLTVTFTGDEIGTITDGTDTTSFEEIERLELGSGNDSVTGSAAADSIAGNGGADTIEGGAGDDTIALGASDGVNDELILDDGFGNDIVEEFEAPTDNGDGTFSGNDQLDVTGLTDAGGDPVNTDDVTVIDTNGDGTGDAILTFPNGESVTLVGVSIAEVSSPEQLEAIGIPLAPVAPVPGVVSGTGAGELIDDSYLGDPEGDMVDNGDGPASSDIDTIQAGAGDDTVMAGLDDDSVLGEAGDDVLDGEAGSDTLDGGDGRDTLIGGTGDDDLSGGADEDFFTLTDGFGDDSIDGGETTTTGADQDTIDASGLTGPVSVTYTGDEAGTLSDGTSTATFTGIETILLDDGDDSVDGSGDTGGLVVDGGLGSDTITGGDGDDSLDGGDDADTLTGGDGADTMMGGAGNDVLNVGSGDDAQGGDGDDTFNVGASDVSGGNLTIVGGESGETAGDTLNVTGPATITMTGTESGTVEWLDGSTLSFSEIEQVNYVPCFTPGTLIKTVEGEVNVAEIRQGDVILTRDNGYQTVRWAGAKVLRGDEIACNPSLQPIRIARGALGKGMPERDMIVSPQHRVVMSGYAIELLFGEDEVLVAATHLVGRPGITRECPEAGVTYVHFMFDRHELVMSDGTWTESFQPGDLSLAGLDMDQREELLMLFPQLVSPMGREAFGAARMSLKAYQARLLIEV